MARVLGPLFLVVALVGGYLWYKNQGTTQTVKTPGAPNADAARNAGGAAIHNGDTWIQTHTTQVGTLLAFLVCGALLWAIWTKLGKGWIVLLVIVTLSVMGLLTVGH